MHYCLLRSDRILAHLSKKKNPHRLYEVRVFVAAGFYAPAGLASFWAGMCGWPKMLLNKSSA
jgi:hypothetical protein